MEVSNENTVNGNMEDHDTNVMEKAPLQDFMGKFVECNEEMKQEMQNPNDDQKDMAPEQVEITPEITNFEGK